MVVLRAPGCVGVGVLREGLVVLTVRYNVL